MSGTVSEQETQALVDWPGDLVHFLNQTTRECRFDWKEIQTRVKSYVIDRLPDIDSSSITVAVCREVFAAVNTVQPPVATAPVDNNIRHQLSNQVLESLTLEELIEHVEKTEQVMNKRKEEIFQRVLHSLGGDETASTAVNIAANIEDDATQAYHKLQQERDELKRKQEERIFEQKERERLSKERELLKKRFDPDSEDAQGEYPLFDGHRRQHVQKSAVSSSGMYLDDDFDDDDDENEQDEEGRARNQAINAMFEEVSMEQFLSGYEFDAILSELEKELDERAVGKDEGELSELGEILNFLDQEAATSSSTKRHKPKTQRVADTQPDSQSAHSSSTSVPIPPTPVRKDIEMAAKDLQTIFGLIPPRPPLFSDDSSSINDSAAPSKASASTSSVKASDSKEGVKENSAADIRSKQLSAVTPVQPRGPHRGRAEYAMQDTKKDENSSSEGEGSSDDDDDNANWRKRRQNMRQKIDMKPVEQVLPLAVASGASGKIWGAYTTPEVSTITSNTTDSTVMREASEDILEVVKAIKDREEAMASSEDEDDQLYQDDEDNEREKASQSMNTSKKVMEENYAGLNDKEQIHEVLDEEVKNDDKSATLEVSDNVRVDATHLAPTTPVKTSPVPVMEMVQESPSVSGSLSGSLLGQSRRAKGGSKGIMTSAARTTARITRTSDNKSTSVVEVKKDSEETSVVQSTDAVSTVVSNIDASAITSPPNVEIPVVTEVVDMAKTEPSAPQVDPYEQLLKQKLVISPNGNTQILPTFPCTSFSDKYSGAKVIFAWSAESQYAEIDASLHSVLTVSISANKISALTTNGIHSDALYIRLIEFLIMKFMNEMKLIALWKCQNEEIGDGRYRLVFQSRAGSHVAANNTISAAYWNEEFSNLTIGDLMMDQRLVEWLAATSTADTTSKNGLVSVKVNDLLEISDFFNHATRILSIIEEGNTSLHQDILYPSFDESDSGISSRRFRLLQSLDPLHSTVTCILKDYLIVDEDEMQVGLLTNLIEQVEESGMRLLGCRLVYLPSGEASVEGHKTHSLWKKHTCHQDIHPTSSVLKTSSATNKELVLIPALCLAFSTSKATMSGGDRIRAILGPEDPILAKKTDPASIRACFGVNREQNVAYSIPFAKEKLMQELSFWFGTSPVASSSGEGQKNLHALTLPVARSVNIGVKIVNHTSCEGDNMTTTTTANALALLRLQKSIVFDSILDKFQEFALLEDFQTTTAASYAAHFYGLSKAGNNGVTLRSSTSDMNTNSTSGQFFIASFTSLVSDLCIHKYWHDLQVMAQEEVKKAQQLLFPDANKYPDGHGYTVQLTLHYAADSLESETNLTNSGSRLALLQALKAVPKEDYRSHEDIGLSDVIVLQVLEPVVDDSNIHQSNSNALASAWTQKVLTLLNLFPLTCHVQVIGAKTLKLSSSNNSTEPTISLPLRHKTLIILRGYQILENIDYVLQELQSTSAANSPSMPSNGHHKRFDTHSTIASPAVFPITYSKGKKALDIIFQEFAPQSLYMDLALQDLIDYVPLSHSFLQASSIVGTGSVASSSSSTSGTVEEVTVERSIESVAKALFPPGNFQAIGLVIIPWVVSSTTSTNTSSSIRHTHHNDTLYTRNLSRVLTRLEKEGFTILCVESIQNVDRTLLHELVEENCKEFLHQQMMNAFTAQPFGTISSSRIGSLSSSSINQGVNATVVMTLRKSALLKLKTIIGPVFDDQLALLNYPRSLAALLASLSPSPAVGASMPLFVSTTDSSSTAVAAAKNSSNLDQRLPALLPVLTCRHNEHFIRRHLPNYLTLFQQLQSNALRDEIQPLSDISNGTEGEKDYKDDDEETRKLHEEEVAKIVNQWMACNESLEKRAGQLKTPQFSIQTRHGADSLQVKTTNIAAIVVTQKLIQLHGLGVILESLHREGLWVTNALTTKVNFQTAKLLLEAAGASSLTMKPSRERMLEGPIVCIGVCGPMHSFVRLKSFTVSAKSTASLWTLNSTDSAGNPEFGVLASSSSSLAKELYCLCFETIFGEESPFVVTQNS